MLLTQTAEYAFRAMAQLALLPPGEKIGARDLSKVTGIPVHYLSKIMRRLVLRKLVAAQKGHGGGFCLALSAGKIRYIDIFRAAGFSLDSKPCVFGWGSCRSSHPCPLHDSWSTIKENFMRWSESTTLAKVKNHIP